jgi:hypothetical protein
MKSKRFGAVIGAGGVLAVAAAIPAAQAKEVAGSHQSTSAAATQALKALDARWNAEAAAYKATLARIQAAKALDASGWPTEASAYRRLG